MQIGFSIIILRLGLHTENNNGKPVDFSFNNSKFNHFLQVFNYN